MTSALHADAPSRGSVGPQIISTKSPLEFCGLLFFGLRPAGSPNSVTLAPADGMAGAVKPSAARRARWWGRRLTLGRGIAGPVRRSRFLSDGAGEGGGTRLGSVGGW